MCGLLADAEHIADLGPTVGLAHFGNEVTLGGLKLPDGVGGVPEGVESVAAGRVSDSRLRGGDVVLVRRHVLRQSSLTVGTNWVIVGNHGLPRYASFV